MSACPSHSYHLLPARPPSRHGPRMRIREGLGPAEEHTVGSLSGFISGPHHPGSSMVQTDHVSGLQHVHYFPSSKLLRSEMPVTIK